MTSKIEIRVPDIGDFSDVEVIELLVAVGDTVELEDGLVSLETDKATMDVPASAAGQIVSIEIAVGDTVNQGDVIAVVESVESSAEPSADEPAENSDDPAYAATAVLPETAKVALKESAGPAEEIDIRVPDIGDFTDVEVIEILVSPGDTVELEDGLLSLETDKATMDVPSSHAGTLSAILVEVGAKVNKGDVIARLKVKAEVPGSVDALMQPQETAPAAAAPAKEKPPAPIAAANNSSANPVLPAVDEAGFASAHASPSVRKLARELGVNLKEVKGTGRKSRIVHDDVKAWVKSVLGGGAGSAAPGGALPAVPQVDFARFGPVSEQKLTRIQKISGPRLQASWINIPHVTQHDESDITELEQRRSELKGPAKEKGISLTPLAFVLRAVVLALKEFPVFSSSLNANGDGLIMKGYCHLGFAADTPNGLMVPVIRDADQMDIYELAQALGELSAAARDGKLKADQMQGAVFTVSSLGGIGGTAFTPIVNAPEVAILGVARSAYKPVWDGENFAPRLILPLSLSYDHRVIDGAQAVRFTTRLGELLTNVAGLLEATP